MEHRRDTLDPFLEQRRRQDADPQLIGWGFQDVGEVGVLDRNKIARTKLGEFEGLPVGNKHEGRTNQQVVQPE